jgi:ubiquinol-cytochrome c reductase iron-sulfur subunit
MCSELDLSRRQFLQKALVSLVSLGFLATLFPFLRSWMPSQKTLLNEAPVSIDISSLEPGDLMTVIWQGKPVWILRRTQEMLKLLSVNNPSLRDPLSLQSHQPKDLTNPWRSISDEYFVALAQCTHMGCIPLFKQKEFLCPCHGSRFDLAGRVVKNVPAPRNLDIPPYHFLNGGKTIVIGEE